MGGGFFLFTIFTHNAMSYSIMWLLYGLASAIILFLAWLKYKGNDAVVQRLFFVAFILLTVGFGLLTISRGYGFFSDGYGYVLGFVLLVFGFALWMDARRRKKIARGESV